VFASHRWSEAKELASQLNIRFEFVRAGLTGDHQPFDRRIFGNLKSRMRRRFDRLWIDEDNAPAIQDSIAMILDAWKSIGQNEILDA
jgi:hypothetical protein